MTSTLLDSRVSTTLDRMFAEASAQGPKLHEMFGNGTVPASATAQERADALSEFYLPVTADAGRLLYALVARIPSKHRCGLRQHGDLLPRLI